MLLRSLYLFGGGGFGLGTPVVSYAPLPMLKDMSGLEIIELSVKLRECLSLYG